MRIVTALLIAFAAMASGCKRSETAPATQNAPASAAAASPAVVAAEKNELAADQAVLAMMDDKMKIISTTPAVLEQRQAWVRRAAKAEFYLAAGSAARQKVAQDFLKATQAFRDQVKSRLQVDADSVDLATAEACVAEARVLVEKVKAGEELFGD